MRNFVRLFYKNEERILSGGIDAIKSYFEELVPHKEPNYIKILLFGQHKKEIFCYKLLEGTGVTPKLFEFGDLGSFHADIVSDFGIFTTTDEIFGEAGYLILEKFGVSLDKIIGETVCLQSSKSFQHFPEYLWPELERIQNILFEKGLEHQDFHSGNLLIKDGELKLIDFEYFSLSDN